MDTYIDTRQIIFFGKRLSYYSIDAPKVGCLSLPITFFFSSPFLTLTKVDWLENGLKDHETEVPCCENLQAAKLSSCLFFFFPFCSINRIQPSPIRLIFVRWIVNVYYEISERDVGVKHVQASTMSLKRSKIDFAPTRTHRRLSVSSCHGVQLGCK